MADHRDTFAREIDEDLRREQLLKLWQAYGTYIVAGVVVIIVGVGGWKFYEARSNAAAQATGSRFSVAVRETPKPDAKPDAPTALDDIASRGPTGYATLARLRLAAADKSAGKSAEALAKYEAIAKDRRTDPVLADYARLQAAVLTFDAEPWTSVQNRLTPLAAESNTWRFSARELLGLAAMKAGKSQEARQEFEKLLTDRNAPPSISERARLMLAMLTEEELAKAADTPKPETKSPDKAPAKPAAKEPEPKKK